MCRRRPVLRSLLVIVGLLLAIVGVDKLRDWRRRVALAEAVEQLSASGEATSWEEWFDPWPSEGENGALDIERAVERFEANAPDNWETTYVGPWNWRIEYPWWDASEERITEVGEFLDSQTDLWAALERATTRPRIVPCKGLDPKVRLPRRDHWHWMRLAKRLLAVRTLTAPTADARLAALHTRFAISSALLREARNQMHEPGGPYHSSVWVLREALTTGRLEWHAARRTVDDVLADESISTVPTQLRRGRLYVIDGVRRKLAADEQFELGPGREWGESLWRRVRGHERDPHLGDLARALLRWQEAVSIEPRTSPGYVTALANAAGVGEGVLRPLPQWPDGWARICLEADTATRLARVALAVGEQRERTGAWPRTLDDVAGSFEGGLPLDPYTGASFEYVPDGDGVILRAAAPEHVPSGTLEERMLEWRLTPR